MTVPVFVALHRGPDSTLGVTRWHLSREEATVCESALGLLTQLQQLHDSRAADNERAQAEARAAGWAAGRDEALDAVVPALLQAWQHAAAQAQADACALRDAVALLSRHVVRRIADGLAPADVVAALARRATEELLPTQPLIVRVHPELQAAVRRHLEAAGRPLDAAALEVRAEPGLDLLDCRVDTPQGQLLAGLETQLDNVVRNLHAGAAASGLNAGAEARNLNAGAAARDPYQGAAAARDHDAGAADRHPHQGGAALEPQERGSTPGIAA